tara:strand:- start:4827 stop:5918 length:1092 start_codon:yes stop_codon:yes gene_type:complete
MICGAGNEDLVQVKKLAFVYTLAGSRILDISANVDVVKAAKEGVDSAFIFAEAEGIELTDRPFLMVSIGMPGDHHVRKSYIDPNKCIGCTLCIPVCPTEAIPPDFISNLDVFKSLGGSLDHEEQSKEIVVKDLCIGCGKCSAVCPKPDIIFYRHNARELRELLPKCLDAGAELFELHAAVGDDEQTLKEWSLVNEINTDNYNSICLDRLNLGNINLEHRIEEVKAVSPDRFIVQADGYPMSGGEDDYNTTLQAVACADIINKKFNMVVNKKRVQTKSGKTKISSKKRYKDTMAVPIILSGGTNSHTKDLADKAGVKINGVAIGTFAREVVQEFIDSENFFKERETIKSAYDAAKTLVRRNTNE